jgi:hypothetical protein
MEPRQRASLREPRVTLQAPITNAAAFAFTGSVGVGVPATALLKGGNDALNMRAPARRLAGWLTTYGKLGPDGEVVPTEDRDGQVFEASANLGKIDWTEYVRGGLWNDSHRAPFPDGRWPEQAPGPKGVAVYVGIGTRLEFHDATSPLAKAHGKVGFFTVGHLWDPADASSWEDYTDYVPNAEDLAKASEFWALANVLDDAGASLGFSAHGVATLSSCRRRILTARIIGAAVCTGPRNPDATAAIAKGITGDVDARLLDPAVAFGKAVPARDARPCGRCSCLAGTCAGLALAKGGVAPGMASGVTGVAADAGGLDAVVRQDIEREASSGWTPSDEAIVQAYLDELCNFLGLPPTTSREYLADFLPAGLRDAA